MSDEPRNLRTREWMTSTWPDARIYRDTQQDLWMFLPGPAPSVWMWSTEHGAWCLIPGMSQPVVSKDYGPLDVVGTAWNWSPITGASSGEELTRAADHYNNAIKIVGGLTAALGQEVDSYSPDQLLQLAKIEAQLAAVALFAQQMAGVTDERQAAHIRAWRSVCVL